MSIFGTVPNDEFVVYGKVINASAHLIKLQTFKELTEYGRIDQNRAVTCG
jgi:hypothetical protein